MAISIANKRRLLEWSIFGAFLRVYANWQVTTRTIGASGRQQRKRTIMLWCSAGSDRILCKRQKRDCPETSV